MAFDSRLSRICSTPPSTARTISRPGPEIVIATCSRSATPAQASARPTAMAATSTSTRTGSAASDRAITSSDWTSWLNRSVSVSAAATRGSSSGSGCSVSRRSRRAVSGVRSWWEASATNRRCASTICSRRSAVVSNWRARARSQPMRRLLHLADGPGHAAGQDQAHRTHDGQDHDRQRAEAQPCVAHPLVDRRRRDGDAHRSMDLALRRNRDGDVDERGVQGARPASPGHPLPVERGGDLGAGGVVALDVGSFGVGHREAMVVHDHDPTAGHRIALEHAGEVRCDPVLEGLLRP